MEKWHTRFTCESYKFDVYGCQGVNAAILASSQKFFSFLKSLFPYPDVRYNNLYSIMVR